MRFSDLGPTAARYTRNIWPFNHTSAAGIETFPVAAATIKVLVAVFALLILFFLISRLAEGRLQRFKNADQLRVWRIGWALTACILGALLSLAGLTWVALALLHFPKLPSASTISVHDLVSVLQLVFASVAGAGALVALVMAYRRQKVDEVKSQHDRTRLLNERFTNIAGQIGHEEPSIRIAGVYAMAGLADDWEENRQTCVDVLCAYLRMPHYSDDASDGPSAVKERLSAKAEREIRQTIIRLIATHLSENAAIRWDNIDFDFTGVLFNHDAEFSEIVLTSGNVSFKHAEFSSGLFSFRSARFTGGTMTFSGARFVGADCVFDYAELSGDSYLVFDRAEFSNGTVSFQSIELSERSGRAEVRSLGHAPGRPSGLFAGKPCITFDDTVFNGATVKFDDAALKAGAASFTGIKVSSGIMSFHGARFGYMAASFGGARFDGGTVSFDRASFSGRPGILLGGRRSVYRYPKEGVYSSGGAFVPGVISFSETLYNGGTVLFSSNFTGNDIDFNNAQFSRGTVSFENAVASPSRQACPYPWCSLGRLGTSPARCRLDDPGHAVVLGGPRLRTGFVRARSVRLVQATPRPGPLGTAPRTMIM
jgi:hypothetical protein